MAPLKPEPEPVTRTGIDDKIEKGQAEYLADFLLVFAYRNFGLRRPYCIRFPFTNATRAVSRSIQAKEWLHPKAREKALTIKPSGCISNESFLFPLYERLSEEHRCIHRPRHAAVIVDGRPH